MIAETYYPLVEAVQRATGRRVHLSTVLRWCTRGTRGIRLESQVLGGRRLTTISAVLRFMSATTAARTANVTLLVTPRQRERAAKRAADQLAKRLSG